MLIQNDYLNHLECKFLIDFYEKNNSRAKEWRDTYPLYLTPLNDEKVNEYIYKTKYFVKQKFNSALEVTNAEIVKWPVNSFQNWHYDRNPRPSGSKLVSICYLNDDYKGGETEIEDMIIKPQRGTTIIFDGFNNKHRVKKVQGSSRYTLIIWYI